jgi:hypothetical protein
MYLRQKNLQMILDDYKTLELFFDDLDAVKRYLSNEDKTIINNSIVYYSNLFDLEGDLEPDVVRLDKMAQFNLLRFRYVNVNLDNKALSLMVDLLTYNLTYVGSLRFLGAS